MSKRHATEAATETDAPMFTLCGRFALRGVAIDNADPDCKHCLRTIAARYRKAGA